MNPECSSRKNSGVLPAGIWLTWWADSLCAMVAESDGDAGAPIICGGPSDDGLYVVGEEVLLLLGAWAGFWFERVGFAWRPKARLS